jgi:hypothetical protein
MIEHFMPWSASAGDARPGPRIGISAPEYVRHRAPYPAPSTEVLGNIIRFCGGGLTVAVDGQLALRADAISLQAQTAMDISSGGSIGVRAEGDIVSEARAQIIRASAGDVRVVANDDVVMDGERIKLNC